MGLREYETIFILKADLTDEGRDRIVGKVEKAMEDHKAVLLIKEDWGKKKLAYDIAKSSKGTYLFYHYLGGGSLVSEIERNLKLDESVLRYMTVKVDEDVDPEARLKAISERPKAPAVTLDDDEDGMGGHGGPRGGRDRGDYMDRGDRGGRDRDDRGSRDRDRDHDSDFE